MKVDRYVYVYMIFGKQIFLVDSGAANSEHEIFDYIRKAGRNPEEVSHLILTHSHPDHIGAARAIKGITGCRICAHPAERMWIEDVELQSKERPVPGFSDLVGGPVTVDCVLEEGNILEIDENRQINVFHTPGHSRGSISLRLQPEGVLFTGDAIPVPGDIPIYEDVESLVRSIRGLMDLKGIRFLLSSWDDPQQDENIACRYRLCIEYLQRIHDAVAKVKDLGLAPMEMCLRVLVDLGLPTAIANPLLTATFFSHLKVRTRGELFRA
jgi:glyoxylase-like metal-dependent hydrolase (beta-lactamase superfamily II)